LILADTSVWIEHFRSGNPKLEQQLMQRRIVIHPFVITELALGTLKDRATTLELLDFLPRLPVAKLNEVRTLIEARRLYNLGIGLTDACLLASVLIGAPTRLWTKDKPLRKVAERLGIDADLS
jgi:predicted nucleic acid-binding protein